MSEVQGAVVPDGWNQFTIIAEGFRLRHMINGVTLVDFLDSDQRNRQSKGVIALQYHAPGENFEVRFKDIRIKLLHP
jgi:Domain of Unknown Function (DUF1080)